MILLLAACAAFAAYCWLWPVKRKAEDVQPPFEVIFGEDCAILQTPFDSVTAAAQVSRECGAPLLIENYIMIPKSASVHASVRFLLDNHPDVKGWSWK